MNPSPRSPFISFMRVPRKHGMALIIVISTLALVTMLMLASFSLTDTDFRTETIVYEQSRALLLADDAVALAQSSLISATSQQFEDGTPKPWTSQPGAIRVHNMEGDLESIYKLYSSNEMTATSVAATASDLPDNWADQKESFVDLNEPKVLASGKLSFPIVDPRAMTNDPLTNAEGFSYDASKGAVQPGADSDKQRLPMPVRWIYITENGTMGTVDGTGRFISATPGARVTRDNPIVGRFAWWVDDETCKVNVNTAGEGSYWDVPVADTAQERSLAKRQPSRLEYYRQPGHPAGVSLSSVLLPGRRQYPYDFVSDADPIAPPGDPLGGALAAMSAEDARDLWRLGRQYMTEADTGTSFGGFRETNWTYLWNRSSSSYTRQARYATMDEMVYDTASSLSTPSSPRVPHSFFQRHPEAIQHLDRGRFFLTADSSAPEVTLFGTPKIALWPVFATAMENDMMTADAPHVTDQGIRKDTVYDHKMAETGTINGAPYFVQRSEPGNGASDFEVHASGGNKKVYEYLQRLTQRSIPGFARPGADFTNFLDKYGDDRDAILIEMLDYIRASNFADGQLAKQEQFSVLCPGREHVGFGQVAPLQQRVVGTGANGSLHPSASNHPQGMGRMLTISEIAMVIVCRAEVTGYDADNKLKIEGTWSDLPKEQREQLTAVGDRVLEVALLVEGFVPEQGWADYRPYATVALFGGAPGAPLTTADALPPISINGQPLVKSTVKMYSGELPPKYKWNGSGGSIGLRSMPTGLLAFQPIIIKGDPGGQVPDLEFMGGSNDVNELKVALYDAPDDTDKYNLIQVVPLKLPDIIPSPTSGQSVKIPSLPTDLAAYYKDPKNPSKSLPCYALKDRLEQSAQYDALFPLLSGLDVIQSLAPVHGDYRLTATQRWAESRVSANVLTNAMPTFAPHPGWGTTSRAASLQDPTLSVLNANVPTGVDYGASWGSAGYDPQLSYVYSNGQATPDIPAFLANRVTGFRLWDGTAWRSGINLPDALNLLRRDQGRRGPCYPEVTGDFDNGLGNAPDGPYNNRADDGNWAASLATGKVPYFDNVSQTGSTTPPVSMSTFSPQRILPSAVVFGGLPSGTRAQVPWQTLLFRPAPPVSATTPKHYGTKTPPDHLLLDLFWSPVIEPEPISLGFETCGKINMNYKMLPFQHIKRATALHALLKAETITAIPNSAASTYTTGASANDRFRHYIDIRSTLRLWDKRVFDYGAVFLTPSQICEQPLVPEGLISPGLEPSTAAMDAYWEDHRITGDNSKERPYARIFPRLTTRSNTYRIHFIAQSLKKARSMAPDYVDTDRDKVTSTIQGSRVVRRTLDMDDPNIPNYLTSTGTTKPLDAFYNWRVGNMEK